MNQDINKIICGDALEELKKLSDESIDMVITSPPYWGLRNYNVEGQLGLEKTPEEYVAKIVGVFREIKRVLKKEGTCWLNLGDSYAMSSMRGKNSDFSKTKRGKHYETSGIINTNKGVPHDLKAKDLVGIPWRVAFALQVDGWYLRQDIIWHKPNPMPESVTDRCTKSHEYIFLLAKNPKYYFNNDAIKEKAITKEERPNGVVRDREYDYDSKQKAMGRHKNLKEKGQTNHTMHIKRTSEYQIKMQEIFGKNRGNPGMGIDGSTLGIKNDGLRNKRSVWTINTKPFSEAHFATFPEKLIEPMVLAGCPPKGLILDPFMGAGTTGLVAKKLGKNYLGIELNPEYIKIANGRLAQYQKIYSNK